MAHGKVKAMTGGITGKGWKPGQSGNPGGKSALQKEFIEALKLETMERARLITWVQSLPISEVSKLANDQNQPAGVGIIARIVVGAWNKSDVSRAEWLARHSSVVIPQKSDLPIEPGEQTQEKITVEVKDYRANTKQIEG